MTQAVDVSWKDSTGVDITPATSGYTITKGSVDEATKIQKSTLTISAATLQALEPAGPLTWKCAAKSTAYGGSPISTFEDLVVTFLKFGRFLESVALK